MLYERIELGEGTPAQLQFLAVHVLCWDLELMGEPTWGFIAIDPRTTRDELTRLREIAQRAREGLTHAKAGSAVWEALRFILSPPVKATETTDEEPTWESLGQTYIDYPEPDQTYGAADG